MKMSDYWKTLMKCLVITMHNNTIKIRGFFVALRMTVILVFFFLPLQAQDSWETYGYAKYLFSSAENKLISTETLNDHQLHLRLNNRWYASDNLTAGIELRLRGFYGGLVKNQPQFKKSVITDYPYGNLESVFWD